MKPGRGRCGRPSYPDYARAVCALDRLLATRRGRWWRRWAALRGRGLTVVICPLGHSAGHGGQDQHWHIVSRPPAPLVWGRGR
ncbi:hypothetical protein [Goodfellowiella coeruleoviolacea]|uniref:Uncharacterized protein n=1 Tax=Goodfellowiella coeruleoviolacea TaxID=334858 RepID=A0AAE3GKK1_9PSEU|nr:hypothetical protein [Goodfellowiella coeruleoviolacea]MCP2169185.1 hypothetical protein [Goodfellowiella coeruleoviolacea]